MSCFSREINKLSTRGGGRSKMTELMHNALFNNTTKIKARVLKTTIFVVKLDFLNSAQLMKVDDSFCQKRPLFAGWVEFVTLPLRRLQL